MRRRWSVVVSTVEQVLRRHGARISEELVAGAVDEVLGRLGSRSDAADLTTAQRQELEAGGLSFGEPADAHDNALIASTAAYLRLIIDAATATEVAGALGVDASRIRHRLADGSLYSLPGKGRTRLIPRFQLDRQAKPLPGLATVLAALPDDLHPLEVAGFFQTPRPDLVLRGRSASPAAYLAAGGAPKTVAQIASGMHVLA